MNTNNQAIVINDLLSFISCKIKVTSRDKLLRSLREYYSEDVILNAQKVLLESLPVKKSTRHGRRVKHPDPLVAMYDCFQLIPSEDLPIFVCRNLNNVPQLDVIKMEMLDERELVIEEEYENSHQDIKYEQIAMKSQIADITDVVKQIKDQLKHIVQQQPSPIKSTKFDKFTNINRPNTALKRRKLSTNSSSSSKFSKKLHMPTQIKERPMPNSRKSPKKTMAYIQQLIDEEAEMKNDSQYEEKDEDSDYIGDISDDEEKVVQNACEVVLKEGLEEGIIQSHRLRGTPVKIPGEKIIYIKNEEEDYGYDYDELRMDEENSIEISSADHYPSFDDIDSFSRIYLEVCGDGTINLLETPKVSNIDLKTINRTVKCTLVKPKLWCSLCGEKYDKEIDLIEHISYHENGSMLQCSLCDFQTVDRKIMRNHLTSEHKKHFGGGCYHEKRYRCVHCKFKSSSKRKMEIHVDTHFEKKTDSCFECEKCGKQYMCHASLRKHKLVHSGVRPFKCEICDDSFVYNSYLKTHMKTHIVCKPFVCSFCKACFSSKMKVIRHERIHTGEKPYSCTECDFKSARSDGLHNHRLAMHSKSKLYGCDKCGQSFNIKQKLQQHYQRNHLPGLSYKCRECEKHFKSKVTLKYHLKVYGHHEQPLVSFDQIT